MVAVEQGCYFSYSLVDQVPPTFALIGFGPSPHTLSATMASADFSLFVITIDGGEPPTSEISPGKECSLPSRSCRLYTHRFRLVLGFRNLLHADPLCLPESVPVRQAATLLAAFFSGCVAARRLAVR